MKRTTKADDNILLLSLLVMGASVLFGINAFSQAERPYSLVISEVQLSKLIPKRGDKVRVIALVENRGNEPVRNVKVNFYDGNPDDGGKLIGRPQVIQTIPPKKSFSAGVTWRPSANGIYKICVGVGEKGARGQQTYKVVEVPVVERDVYFAWFGTPRGLRYANVSTTAKRGEVESLAASGMLPCRWKGGAIYKKWSIEEYVKSWSDAKYGIAIDEFGGDEATCAKMIEAARRVKQKRPDLFIAFWGAGGFNPSNYAALKECVDLFMPEVYLNYLSFHLGRLESAIESARRASVIEKTIIGLGINDKEHGAPRSPTPDEVREQVKHIKRLAPKMPGLAFFNFYGAPKGIPQLADQLCYDYFIAPVISIVPKSVELQKKTEDSYTVRARLRNIGNIAAKGVTVRFLDVQTGKEPIKVSEQFIEKIPVDAEAAVEAAWKLRALSGFHRIRVEVVSADSYTVLDGVEYADLAVGIPWREGLGKRRLAVVVPSENFEREGFPIQVRLDENASKTIGRNSRVTAVRYNPSGEVEREYPAQLDFDVTTETAKVTWIAENMPRGRDYYYLYFDTSGGDVSSTVLSNDIWKFSNSWYQLTLDVRKDAIIELSPSGSNFNLLKTPWQFGCTGYEGIQKAGIVKGPVFTEVTIPFDSAMASGKTIYCFYRGSPVIRISREFVPKKELTIHDAGEGCTLQQRGGTYQLQGGVGAKIRSGKLINGSKYRDLLFGYLGAHPEPSNFDKAGWFDFSWPEADNAGLGIVIERRWRDAASRCYDVTRYYDAGDWINLFEIFQIDTVINRRQTSTIYLLPHNYFNFEDEKVVSPAYKLWRSFHNPARAMGRLVVRPRL